MHAHVQNHILVTGFGPFPGHDDNPSDHLARALDGTLIDGMVVRGLCLKTEFGASLRALRRAIHHTQPRLVICFGVSAHAAGFVIERMARNTVTTTNPDAGGYCYPASTFLGARHQNFSTTLPVDRLISALSAHHLPAAPSDNAGNYLCNYLFFHLMNWASQQATPPRAGFIHIPPKKILPPDRAIQGAMLILKNAL